jgi:hypothetical protein
VGPNVMWANREVAMGLAYPNTSSKSCGLAPAATVIVPTQAAKNYADGACVELQVSRASKVWPNEPSPCLFRQTLTCQASGSAGPSAPPIRIGAGREGACWIGTGWSSGSHRARSRSSPVSGSTAKHVAQGGIQDGYVRHLQAVPCERRNASGLDDLLQEMSD